MSHALGDAGSPYMIGAVSSSYDHFHLSHVFLSNLLGGVWAHVLVRSSWAHVNVTCVAEWYNPMSVDHYRWLNVEISIRLSLSSHTTLLDSSLLCCLPFQISDAVARSSRIPGSIGMIYVGLHYALYMSCFVAVLGGGFFLATAVFLVGDKKKAREAMQSKWWHLVARCHGPNIICCSTDCAIRKSHLTNFSQFWQWPSLWGMQRGRVLLGD